MRPLLTDMVSRGWARARSLAARPRRGVAEPPERVQRRVSLDVSQAGDTVVAEFALEGTDILGATWVLHGAEWLSIGTLRQIGHDGGRRTYEARFDLGELARLVDQATGDQGQAPTPINSTTDDKREDVGTRVRFFIKVTSPSGYKRRVGRIVRPDDPEAEGEVAAVTAADDAITEQTQDPTVRYRDPLGRYAATTVPTFFPVQTAHGTVTPYLNREGVLAAIIGAPLPPTGRIRNDGLSVRDGVLKLRGALFTRHVELAGAHLVIQGRTTGYRVSAPAELIFDEERSRRRFGLRAYAFTSTYTFGADLGDGLISDDVADLFIEFRPSDGSESYKRRVGRSRFRVRARTRGGHVTRGDKTLSIEPYYTFKAKNPSLQFEVFDAEVHAHLRHRLSIGALVGAARKRASRPVWIIGELPYKAQDNGMYFFRYMREQHPEIDAYYVIRENSPERRNLAGFEDHVLKFRSTEHIDKVLEAERIIGTHQPDFLYPSRTPSFQRRVHASKVFLQHGVTGAKWMVPKYGKRASGFDTSLICVCSEREKEFFVTDFGYSPEEVTVTGFARFDALFHDDVPVKDRQIVVMPTWRPWLQDPETFTESEYFERWHGLLTGAMMSWVKEQAGAEVVLCLHPNMQQFSHHFTSPQLRVVIQGEVDVQRLIKESAVMITDYSSVAFDFAFLRKPVIYYQFDAERSHAPHAHPRTELPGAIVVDEAQAVTALATIGERGWRMSDVYWERARRFCEHVDRHNRERIFRAVRDLEATSTVRSRMAKSEVRKASYRTIRRNKRYLPTMRRLYRLFKLLPMNSDLIVFESGQGRHFSDSPRYIYEELLRRGDTRKKVWIYDRALPVRDEHTIVVKRHSLGFYWYLARAKYWVNNHTFPHYITRRRKGQYVQTWHGTPLKRMFLDQEAWFGRDPGYKDRVTEAVAQWSVLVSPSPYVTECMRTAYAWQGPVIEVGYPRNDILLDGSAQGRAATVRQRLGISSDQRVVLYAPTFRDDRPTRRGRFAFDMPIDLEEWHARFGADHVLLIRTHVLVSNRVAVPRGAESSIIDVSRHPDIQELFLASDVLVTDYSSVFFDYALLGRPTVFYAYDLHNYRDNLRGFYLPYDDDTLPGPITTNQEELFQALEKARNGEGRDQRVLEFARVYAPHDDGRASARVVDRLLRAE